MPTPGVELLNEFNAAFNRHDVDGMMERMTADCVFENTYPPPEGERFEGQAAVRQFWEAFFRLSPGARLDFEEIFTCGERAFQRWSYHWQDAGGTSGHVRGVDIFRFKEGKIAEKLSYVKG
jgi:ketosteroid isomerase-like protein